MSRKVKSRREIITSAGAVAATAGALSLTNGRAAPAQDNTYDVIVVGGGNAGLPAAIFAAGRGARVLIVEAAGQIGGTLFLSSGQMSAAGTKLQKEKGIDDSPDLHFEDIMRISKGTADRDLVRLAVNNAAPAFDWLMDNGFEVKPEHPVTGTTHEPYSRARYAWAKEGGGVAILDVLERKLQPHIDAGLVTVLTSTEVVELIQATNGDVIGVKVKGEDGSVSDQYGKNTVLTCGGYTYNPEMFEELEHVKINTQVTYPYSRGAGITLALSAGGYVRGGDNHTPLFGAVLSEEEKPTTIRSMIRHFPGNRPPWEIIVDGGGQRFFPEDVLSHDVYEQALAAKPEERCWFVFDDKIFKQAPPLARQSMAGPWSQEDTVEAFTEGDVPYFYRSNNIRDLALKADIEPDGLEQTVETYNRAQSSGKDSLGRKFMPLPIKSAPFYAIETYSWALTGYAGVAVDKELRVIRQDESSVNGLYAAGELLGMGQLMGRSVCGGMSVTPALALGRLLGHKLLDI